MEDRCGEGSVIDVIETSYEDRTDMTNGGTLTALRYRDETLDPFVKAIGDNFILMQVNVCPNTVIVCMDYLSRETY